MTDAAPKVQWQGGRAAIRRDFGAGLPVSSAGSNHSEKKNPPRGDPRRAFFRFPMRARLSLRRIPSF
jgi:hypothetical protein